MARPVTAPTLISFEASAPTKFHVLYPSLGPTVVEYFFSFLLAAFVPALPTSIKASRVQCLFVTNERTVRTETEALCSP